MSTTPASHFTPIDEARVRALAEQARGWEAWSRDHAAHLRDRRDGRPFPLLFLGDSNSQNWFGTEPHAVADAAFGTGRWSTWGIGGDRIEQLHWRLAHGLLDNVRAETISLLIGTNNLEPNDDDTIVSGIAACLDLIRRAAPASRRLLTAIPPKAGIAPARLTVLNATLRQLAHDDGAAWVDFSAALQEPDGSPDLRLLPDGVHLSKDGYRHWAKALLAQFTD